MPKNNRSNKAKEGRRTQVANACESCRNSKVKCSGKHPQCARCKARGAECVYDVSEEGMTKRQYLRRELSGHKQKLEHAMTVLNLLRNGTDQEATETLARLRLGQSVGETYRQLTESDSNEPHHTSSYEHMPPFPIPATTMTMTTTEAPISPGVVTSPAMTTSTMRSPDTAPMTESIWNHRLSDDVGMMQCGEGSGQRNRSMWEKTQDAKEVHRDVEWPDSNFPSPTSTCSPTELYNPEQHEWPTVWTNSRQTREIFIPS